MTSTEATPGATIAAAAGAPAESHTPLRVRFGETDQMGIAHHSAYVLWLEAARVEWLRERGFSYREMEDTGVSLAVSRIEIDYRAAARFDDELRVTSTLTLAKSRRFRFVYRIVRPADDALLATAVTVHTPTDRNGHAIRLPDTWLAPLARYASESA